MRVPSDIINLRELVKFGLRLHTGDGDCGGEESTRQALNHHE